MMMGAGTVQLATAAMWYGFDIVKGWNENILTFMKEHGYDSLADLKGITLPKITELEKLDYVKEVYSDVDTERCIDCRRCVTACRDGATDAMKNPKLNDVDYEKCVGCGLCKMVCPQNCISMIINKDKK
jgi:dihydropyrimidine dehydrogenase (NAD+) subunit PreA